MTTPIFTDMPTVERGIPIPVPCKGGGSPWTAFLHNMQDGDSFLVGDSGTRESVCTIARKAGLAVTSRKVAGKGYRIWRIGKRRAK